MALAFSMQAEISTTIGIGKGVSRSTIGKKVN